MTKLVSAFAIGLLLTQSATVPNTTPLTSKELANRTVYRSAVDAVIWGAPAVITSASEPRPIHDLTFGSNDTCSNAGSVVAAACSVHKQALWALAAKIVTDSHRTNDALGPILSFVSPNLKSSPDLQRQYRIAVAFAAMDYVQANASTALYGFESASAGFIVPSTADEALSRSIGICGNHIAAYEAILGKLEVPVRHVQLWYTDATGKRESHILAEVEWDGRWHLFDVTWGAHFPSPDSTASDPDPLPIETVLSEKPRPIYNPNNPATRFVFAVGADPFAYLYGKDLGVTIADVGEVVVTPKERRGDTLVENFDNIPNFVGFNRPEARSGGTSFLFRGFSGRFDVTVIVTAYAGCGKSRLVLDAETVKPREGTIQFRGVTNPRRLSVSSSDDVCYIVMKSVEFSPTLDRGIASDANTLAGEAGKPLPGDAVPP
jgi:hypothetical protein